MAKIQFWLRRTMALLLVLGVIVFLIWRTILAFQVNAKLKAVRAAGLPLNGVELNAYYSAVPDNENAALVMTQAFALLRNYPDHRSNEVDELTIPGRGQKLTGDQVKLLAGYVAMNSNALAKARQAIQLPLSRYPVDLSRGFDNSVLYLDKVREVAWLFEDVALLDLNSNQLTNIDDSISGVLQLARTLDGEPGIMSQLIHFSIVRTGVKLLELRLNAGGVTDGELTNLAAVFAGQKEENFAERALIGERAMFVPYFRVSPLELNRILDSGTTSNRPPNLQNRSVWWEATGIFERDLNFYLGAMQTNIAMAALPPPQSLARLKLSDQMGEIAGRRFYILSAGFLPWLSAISTREAECFARVRLATTAIAIEHFRLAQGRLPEKLNDLVPGFLPVVLDDPFDGQPLRYHQRPKGYVIYSVGRDGHDDGGREPPAHVKSSDKTNYDITFIVER